jgi:hypothetical protein
VSASLNKPRGRRRRCSARFKGAVCVESQDEKELRRFQPVASKPQSRVTCGSYIFSSSLIPHLGRVPPWTRRLMLLQQPVLALYIMDIIHSFHYIRVSLFCLLSPVTPFAAYLPFLFSLLFFQHGCTTSAPSLRVSL